MLTLIEGEMIMTAKLTVTAKVPANKEKGTNELGPASVTVVTGETAAEMIQLFGDEAVKSNADANWRVTIQGNIRSALRAGKSATEIQAQLGTAKLGVATRGVAVDPIQAYVNMFATATPKEQEAMLKKLTDQATKK